MYEDFSTLTHSGIRSLQPYVPGKTIEEVAKEQGLSDIIKLASNENAWGCSPAVWEALRHMGNHSISLYPQSSQHPFRHQLAKHLNIEPNMLTLSNGSDMIIGHLLNCFALHQPKHVLTHRYAFMTYAVQAQTLGIPMVVTPTQGFEVDIDAIIKTCQPDTALIFIANPNNPTGLLIEHTEIIRLLEHIPATTLLVLDEAYYEYAGLSDQSIKLLAKYNNLIILRTFSKAYGLAGLRLGYAIAHPQITKLLYHIQLPFVVNIVALTAAGAALDDHDFMQKTLRLTQEGLRFLYQSFNSMGIQYLPSHGNFVTIHCGKEANHLFQHFQEHGIVLRPLDSYGMSEYLRITVGTEEQNCRLIEVCHQLLR